MTFTEFSESRQNSKVVWLPGETPYLTTDRFLDVVVKKIFLLLSLGWYLFTMVSCNSYLTQGSNGKAHSITTNGNVSVASWIIPLVTIPFLDFVKIHWIHWIQWKSFRKNPNSPLWKISTTKNANSICLKNSCSVWSLTNLQWWWQRLNIFCMATCDVRQQNFFNRVFHRIGTIAITMYYKLLICTYLQFPSSFAPYDISKCEIGYWVSEDYISRLQTSLVWLIFNDTARRKSAILAFL